MEHSQANRRPLGTMGALTIGLGSIIGGSVFATMGPAVMGAGGGTPLAYFLGAIPAYLTAVSYVRMAKRHPAVGGTVGYFNIAFRSGYLSASLNLLLVVCYAAVASLYAGVFGVYAADLLDCHDLCVERLLSCLAVATVAAVNICSDSWGARIQGKLNIAKFLVMGVFILAAFLSPVWQGDNFSAKHWKPVDGIIATGMGIFMSYQGFELMVATRRPFLNPSRTLPLAFGLCLGLVTLFYCAVATATVGNVVYADVPAESNYIISAVARRFMGDGGGVLLCVGAVLASYSAINADVFSVSPMPGNMAAKGEMPPGFSSHAQGTPRTGVIFICILLLLFVNLVSVDELTAVSSMGFLVVYSIVNFAALRICRCGGAGKCVGVLAAFSCLAAAVTVGVQTFSGPRGILLAWVTGGMLFLPFVWQALFYVCKYCFNKK